MIVEDSKLVDLHRALRLRDIFTILPAAGIRAEGRRHESQRPLHAVGFHLPQRIGQQRMPVAIAPIDRQAGSAAGEFALQCGYESAILGVDRGPSVKQIVVFGHFEHTLAGHVSAAEHVFKKGNYVLMPLRAPKGNQQQRIILGFSIIFS